MVYQKTQRCSCLKHSLSTAVRGCQNDGNDFVLPISRHNHYSNFSSGDLMADAVKEWSYVLLHRDKDGVIDESVEVTDEVLYLYRMVEIQEKLLNQYRLNSGYDFLVSEPSVH
jgi:hypothetical protein